MNTPLKRVEDKPFTWVPAAITYPSDGGLGIYIKYGKYPDRIVVREQGNGYIWVQCPDRELVLVANTHTGWGFRPMNGNFDEYVHIGPYNDNLNADMNLPYFMVNYVAESSKKVARSRSLAGLERDPNSLIMADSGGFQILQGRVEYLDPQQIIDWYNDNVDIGFALDIPVSNVDVGMLRRSAKIHARNNEIMVAGKRDGLELMNIVHGSTFEKIQMYREMIEHPEIDRMAIGGLYHYFNLLASMDVLYRLSNSGQQYKHLHVLGVSNSLHVALLTRLATKGLVPHLTSDSSTAMQKARLREWHTVSAIHEKVKFTLVGYKDGYMPSPHALLPCSCQVCSAIKYADVLWCLNGNTPTKLFEFHNIYSMTRYFDMMTEVSKEMSTKELKQLFKHQIGENRQGFEEALHALDYIDDLASGKDYDIASEKYRIFLGDGLFSDYVEDERPQALMDDRERGVDEDEPVEVAMSEDACDMILKRYEDVEISSNLKHGKKLKTEVANTRKTRNSAGGASIKPTTAAQFKKKNLERGSKKSTKDDSGGSK